MPTLNATGRVLFVSLLSVAVASPFVQALQTGPGGLDITLRARSFQPGELVAVGLTIGAEASAVHVRVFDRTTPASRIGPGKWEALVGIDLDQPPGEYALTAVAGGGVRAVKDISVAPRAFPVRRLSVNPDFVNPPKSQQSRIAEEARFVRDVYAGSASQRLWTGPWVRPVPHPANSRFGTRSVFNGEARNPHTGADFLSPAGTPIHAPNAGRVVAAREMFFSGRIVIVDHGLGVFSQMAHMSRIDVREGVMVEAGQIVGLVGATGRVTGAHLHWGLRVGTARVDPLAVLALFAPPEAR